MLHDPELLDWTRRATITGRDNLLDKIGTLSGKLIPNEPVDLPKWAVENIVVPTSVSDRSGPFEMNPIQRAIARLWQEMGVRQVDYLKIARSGSTLLIASGLCYYTGHLGYDTLFYERSDDAAQDFHDKKLYQIMINSPTISAMMRADTKAGVQDAWSDRILDNGASIQLRSGQGPVKSIKGLFVVIDEAGDSIFMKGPEGSKVSVIRRRLQEFCAPILFVSGTPTNVGECTISDEYSRSDKRHWMMPCPHCADQIAFDPDVRPGSREEDTGVGLRYVLNDRKVVIDAWYACKCGGHIEETSKIEMLEAGEFVATDIGEPGHVGCYTWAAHSTDPQMTWRHIGAEHQSSLRNEKARQAYVTLVLAQAYDPSPPITVDPSVLQERIVDLGDGIDCPEDTVYLVASGDNQKGRREDPDNPPRGEVTVIAVRENGRMHVVRHETLSHLEYDVVGGERKRVGYDPFDEDFTDAFHSILEREYVCADGRLLRIQKTFVDCSWQTELAYKFCTLPRSRELGIVPIRGDTTERGRRRVSLLPSGGALRRSQKSGRSYLWIGTRDAKDEVARRLAIPNPAPYSITFSPTLTDRYFKGLLAERLVDDKSAGMKLWVPVGDEPSEPWDCLQYAYAAAELIVMKNRRLRKKVYGIDPAVAEAATLARIQAQEEQEPPSASAPATALPDADPEAEVPEKLSAIRVRVVQRKVRNEPVKGTDGVSDRVRRVRARKTGIGW